MTHEQPIRRRTVLRTAGGIAIASVVAGCLNNNDNDGKLPKSDVSYQDHPMKGQQCAGCEFFISAEGDENTGRCTQVEGKIAPDAWCGLYSPK
jgi:hypothetical protein